MRDPRDTFRVGAWFSVPEGAVRQKGSTLPFAPAKAEEGRGGRRVIQASPLRDRRNMVFFARSASRTAVYDHKAHDHLSDYQACRIDKDGWVELEKPVTVDARELVDENWSCVEPDTSSLYTEMERWLRS